MSNVARSVIWPTDSDILVRVVFLYVGQGDSAVVLVKDGGSYKSLLVDINRDEKNGGINVPRMMSDLLKKEGGRLDAFVNTHPHNDHLRDVSRLSDELDILEVWHSGHKPGKKHDDAYQELQEVIKKVKKNHGDNAETELLGSRTAETIGGAQYHVLSPAKHIKDDIDDEDADTRYRRIHEQCVVMKFGDGSSWVMLTGDADRDAWEKNITQYHKERLPAKVLGAAHHGFRTFFRYDEEDEPYLEALKGISPTYVIISAPKRKDSPHGHPHKDAVEFYADEVGEDNVLHSGENKECYICDIRTGGDYEVRTDSKLVDEYGFMPEGNDGKSKATGKGAPAIVTTTRVDKRPMGNTD